MEQHTPTAFRPQKRRNNSLILVLFLCVSCQSYKFDIGGTYLSQSAHVFNKLELHSDATFQQEIHATGIGRHVFTGNWIYNGRTVKLISQRIQPDKALVLLDAIKSETPKVVMMTLEDSTLIPGISLIIGDEHFISNEQGEIHLPKPLNGDFKVEYLSLLNAKLSFASTKSHQINIYIQFPSPTKAVLSKLPVKRFQVRGDTLLSKKYQGIFKKID